MNGHLNYALTLVNREFSFRHETEKLLQPLTVVSADMRSVNPQIFFDRSNVRL